MSGGHSKPVVAAIVLMAAMLGMALPEKAGVLGEPIEDQAATLKGTITKIDRPLATLLSGGEEYSVHLGPFWFWDRMGYGLEVGDRVTVTGQVAREGKRVNLYLQTMERGGGTYVFADEDGVPAWSRGRGAGRGPRAGPGGPGPGPHGAGGAPCPCCAQHCPMRSSG